ncbi:hypothetical protein OG539_32710 [Actinacidiphila glaucinigra]|uniref:hypothetical protein n=1 Tax=Actinacidiphila glaucinigra TaxID=235986 RepID=UPI00324B2BE0
MTVDQAYRELDAEEAAGHAAYLAAGGAFARGTGDNIPGIPVPPPQPPAPRADDVSYLHYGTRAIQDSYEFESAA